MQDFVVCGVNEAVKLFPFLGVTHAVSFRDHSFDYPRLALAPENWLQFDMYDRYFEPGTPQHVAIGEFVDKLIAFARALPEDAIVGFNCMMGISRSTAGCLIACVTRMGLDAGMTAFWREVGHRGASPNQVLLEHADARLGLAGKLIDFGEYVHARHIERPNAMVPHRKAGVAPPNDPWDDQ